MSAEKITIVGVGRGSLGLAIKRCHPDIYVTGVDREKRILEKAKERGALDKGYTDLANGVSDADLVVLATPVRTIIHTFHLYFESVEAAERAASILSTEGYQSYLIA